MPTIWRRCPRHHTVYAPPTRCVACTRSRELARGSTAQRGYGSRHQTWARAVLRLHPVCPCGQPATIADHVTPFRAGGPKYNLDNGQGLCLRCSGRKDGGRR